MGFNLGTALAHVAGGALKGFSEGVILDIREERNRQHAELERNWRSGESQKDRDARSTENKTDRDSRIEQSRIDRESREKQAGLDRGQRASEAGASREQQRSIAGMNSRFPDADGNIWTMDPDGGPPKPVNGPDGKQLKAAKPPEQLVEVQDPDDPSGTIMVPRSKADGMKGKGTKDTRDAARDADDLLRSDAKKKATEEAKAKGGIRGPMDGSDFPEDGSRDAFVKRRTEEIYQERKKGGTKPKPGAEGAATVTAEPPAKSGGAQAAEPPKKDGGRGAPPTDYPDAVWSQRAGGWVVQRGGKWQKVEG